MRLMKSRSYLPLIMPAVLIYSVFLITPFFMSIWYAFTNWDGLNQSYDFVGFDNFRRAIFSDSRVIRAFMNTLRYCLIVCVIQNAIGLGLSLLFDRKFFGRTFAKAIFFLPNIFNGLIVCFVWAYMYNPSFGILKQFFSFIGLEELASVVWLGDANYVILGISFTIIWQFAGTSMILYLAGLQSISTEIYEAAHIDGAGAFQRMRRITIPLLAPAFTINIVYSFIGTMKIFDYIVILTRGGPGDASQSISTLLYDMAFGRSRFGYAAALGVLLFIIIATVSVALTFLLRRREVEA